jgi:hypothetical protein
MSRMSAIPNTLMSRCSHKTLQGKRCKNTCSKGHYYFCHIHKQFVQKEIDNDFESKTIEDMKIPQISDDVLRNVLQPYFGEKFTDFFRIGKAFVVRGGVEVYNNPHSGHGYEMFCVILENVSSFFHVIFQNEKYLKLLSDPNEENRDLDKYLKNIFDYEKSGKNWSQVRICPISYNIQFFVDESLQDVILHKTYCFAEVCLDVEHTSFKNIRQFSELSTKVLEFFRNPESKTISYTKTIRNYNGQVEYNFE